MRSEGERTGMRTVILAGGKGARLMPYTAVLPKPLMPVGDMPILEIVIRQLHQMGIVDITMSVGHLASLIEAYFGDGHRWGVSISYSYEDRPLGTAGPLVLIPGLTNTFLVMNGDILTSLNYAAMMDFHKEHKPIATVGIFTKKVEIDLGVVKTDENDQITNYIEKPILNYEVSMGVYIMEPCVLKYIPPGEPFDLPDLVKRLMAERQTIIGYRFNGYWLDIGRSEDYAQAVELFERKRTAFLTHE